MIAVNLLWCVPGEVGGSEEYLVRQLLGLADDDPVLAGELRIFGTSTLAAAHPDLAARYPIVAAPFTGRNRMRRIVGEGRWLRHHTAAASLTHHGGGTAPLSAPRPFVLTIHDLQYRTFPQYFSPVKLAYLRAIVPRSARAAAAITVPSGYVRRTVIDAFGIDPARVHVVRHGIEPSVTVNVTPAAELRHRYRLGNEPYLIYPAVTHPHKNHRLLIDLLAGPWRDRAERVVLIGGQGRAETEVAQAAQRDRRLLRLGRVPDADRNGLIAAAEALLFPSTYEGFGAPLIEAMGLGTPVLCADAASLPEVAGDAAVVRQPTVEAWADSLDVLRADAETLIAAGRRRAATFTAAASGADLAAVYRSGR